MLAQKRLTNQISDATSAKQLLDILDPFLESETFNGFHISVSFSRLARNVATFDKSLQESQTVSRLMEKVRQLAQRSPGLPPRVVANVFWAIASLGDKGRKLHTLLSPLVDQLVQYAGRLNTQDIANSVWACATLQLPEKELERVLPILRAGIAGQKAAFRPQDVSNMIWAMGVLKRRAPELLKADQVLGEMAVARAAEFEPQALSNIMWSAATLKGDAPNLLATLQHLTKEILRLRTKFFAQNVVNIVWAIARLKEDAPELQELLPDLLAEVPRVAKDLTAQGAANLLWAGATLRTEQPGLWQGVLPELRRAILSRLRTAGEQELSNSLWALALLDESKETADALHTLAIAESRILDTMSPQGLCNSCYGLALRNVRCDVFLNALSETLGATAMSWSSAKKVLNFPTVFWTYARLGVVDETMLKVLAQGLEGALQEVPDWGLCVRRPAQSTLNEAPELHK